MATKVYDELELELQDGKIITCRPLNIKKLREFMREFAKMDDEGVRGNNDKSLQVLFKCSCVAMSSYAPDYTMTQLEDVLDIQTMYKIIEVASGIKLGEDPGN